MIVHHPDSNLVGSFNLTYEMQTDRELVGALMGVCTVLHAEAHESGRGTRYIAASPLFQPLNEEEVVPEYRIEFRHAATFEDPEAQARRVDFGKFGFVAYRQTVVRVPTISTTTRVH